MNSKKNLKRNLLICLLAGSAVMYTLPLHAATSVIGNNQLPTGGQSLTNNHEITPNIPVGGTMPNNPVMTIKQDGANGIIKWGTFDVGGSATVNFEGNVNGYNTLNYVNGANMSQIYGTINANNNGNIFIVNPAGVQIGNSAQINVGSLHVSNAKVTDEYLKTVNKDTTVNEFLKNAQMTNAALMSLGNINANKVTFEGNGRIVIDSERLKDVAGTEKLTADKIFVNTKDKNNVVIGYDAYENGSYANVNNQELVTLNGSEKLTKAYGYMWVEDVEQLQAINTNLSGNYALRNSIDATSTEQNGFTSIGSDDSKAFTGNFDGIDYNIFGLTIKNDGENTGLFGYTNNATISNVTLVGGSITGKDNVGAIVGSANNTTLTNVVNSAAVSGNSNVGGIVGSATNSAIKDAINTGTINGSGDNVGGLIGNLQNSKFIEATDTTKEVEKGLIGNSYNLGDVSGKGHNVGGLVGHAVNSTIGDGTNLVYNRMDVTGAYNVGGIVGNMEGSIVKYAENSGTVMATGHTTEYYKYHTGETVKDNLPNDADLSSGIASVKVDVANAGGIAGTSSASNDGTVSKIENVTNTANVSSKTNTYEQYGSKHEYYTAGNVGGIVGRAEDTNISDATNQENEIRGAHNVGGVAGYFGSTGTVSGGINDGGDIMATGARYNDNFVRELIRPVGNSNESFIIGNIGGVVGYMDGDNVYVTESANRGTVHSQDIEEENAANVLYTSQAANVGGVVGKIDRSDTKGLVEIKNNTSLAAVNNSYNTGDVRGYTGVGGVVGMMYNGEVASSYNLGYLRTTRIATNGENIEAVNMGGIVGDTTEGSRSKGVIIYDVYNKGQIGDDTYTYYARHVAGIVGRLSGTVEKAYNNGEIYNGYTATGGIAGWMYEGSINNAFNTGNITVYNHDSSTSQVGGIVGAASVASGDINLTNVYNLGTLRSFQANSTYARLNHNVGANSVAGIIGAVMNNRHDLIIENAYTTGNIYAGNQDDSGNIYLDINNDMVGSIYGENRGVRNNNTGNMEYADINRTNTYYIRPENGIGFTRLGTNNYGSDNSNKGIDYEDRDNVNENENVYSYYDNGWYSLNFSSQSGGNVTGNTDSNWRLYPNGTPILNAFLPNTENYFSETENMSGISSIQYGTAYDPLLTIINAANETNNLSYNWSDLGISNAAGIAVYGAGLTLENVNTSGSSSGYYGGLIYSDGVLTINAADNEGLAFGSGADIYGSSVALNADGTITIYGDVTATGNGTAANDDPDKAGSINIASNDSDINVYGTLTSATAGESVTIPGISGAPDSNWRPVDTGDSISDPSDNLNTIGERYEHTTTASAVNGNITIEAGTWTDADKDGIQDAGEVTGGNIGLYYGNKGEGITTTGGNLTITGTGDVYVDSDLDIGGDLKLDGTGAESEVVLDITNIGEVQEKNDNTDADNSTEYLHDFLNHFANNGNIVLTSASGDAKLAVDMWDENLNNNQGAYNLNKFNYNGQTFVNKLNNLNFYVNNVSQKGDASNFTYIWVSTAEQLQGIQDYYNAHKNDSDGTGALTYNYALKNDINASDLTDYEAIGTGATDGFTGTFDGRGNRIIGLDATQTKNGNDNQVLTNAGIFSTVGDGGTVKNLNVYSGTFTGSSTAGAIAGINNGTIENITAFGNTVTSNGNAGGIAGTNSGTVDDVESSGSVIGEGANAIVGGLVGTNERSATVNNSYSNSAVTSTSGTDEGLGGVVGVNEGTVSLVDSLGVTNGTNSINVGGVIGINSGTLNSAYNESIVNGYSNVGGIIGTNGTYTVNDDTITWTRRGTVSNIVNATSVTGEDESVDNVSEYVGGLVGINGGSIENGRNNGTITGTKYVGGMVGSNAQGATLTNITNDSSAAIEGEKYVGGIAGSNAGKISATDDTLINRGSITGNKFVGGVAGVNENGGTIENTISNIELNVKTPYTNDGNLNNDPAFFGGVVGQNSGTIIGATNQSSVDVAADGATYVGGIIGQNTSTGTLEGKIRNGGTVSGLSNVGGIIGENKNANLLNNDDNNERLEITNTGSVRATQGGAAGIFYSNNISGTEGDTNANAINNVDITNSGTVTGGTDENSVTGGLFGINSGNITNSTLTNTGVVTGGGTVGGLIGNNSGSATDSTFTNSGTVSGNTNVGGLFGTNSGKFETSSLINTVNAQVIGIENVGGLIGYNTGTITGGRDEADSYYKYKVYNNGVINVGTWTDSDGDGVVDVDTNEFNAQAGSDIGGLIGENAVGGNLTAGYNTGAINANGSTNVGGIAGSNEGTIDQVFNTVYNTDGTTGAIAGGTNVGGLVGNNSGTLSNAYNTAKVVGNSNVGTIIGNNINNVSNVYNTWNVENSNIIGTGNSANKAYNIDSNKQADYSDLDFNHTWKIYEGNSNPLLKVFLTNLTIKDVNENGLTLKEFLNIVYNGNEQDLNIKDLIDNGFVEVPDEEALKAYYNTPISDSNLGESYLLDNTDGQKTAGSYNNWLYSAQIHGSTDTESQFNPNNLGYDIIYATNDSGTIEIDKAKLTITLDDVYRIYGQLGLKDDYTYSIKDIEGLVAADANYETLIDIVGNTIVDSSLADPNTDGKVTKDAGGNYSWSANVTLDKYITDNYDVEFSGGNSYVEKANLTITLDDVERVYGNIDFANGTGYAIESANLVNGDSGLGLDLSKITVSDDGALIIVNGETRTNNVDNYNWSVSNDASNFTGVDKLGTNYNITVVAGDSNVTPKTITLADIVATIVYGNQDGKGFVLDSNSNLVLDGLVYGDGDNVTINGDAVYNVIEDSEYDKDRNGRDTADVGTYEDSLSVSGITLSGKKAGNYDLDTTAAVGNIIVTKATLNVTLNNVEHIYGDAGLSNGTNYGISGVTGIVNSDNKEDINNSLSFVFVDGSDTALTGSTGRVTDDVGTGYEYQGTVNTTNNNYKVVVNGTNSNTGIGKSEVTKATVQINLDDITHVYGQPSDDYKIKDDINWVNGDAYSVNDIVITDNTVDDDAIDKTTGKTNNAGGQYKWNASVDASGNNAEIINQNYNFEVVKGNSYVDQAELTINLGDVTHTYGEPNKNGYTFTANGWVYGEDYSGNISIGSLGNGITDNALKDNNEHTNNANTEANPYYTWTTNDYSISGEGAVNYKITVVNDGKSYVDKANLVITADDANTTIGNMPDRFTGTDIQEQLVNGDIISDDNYHYGVSADTDVNIAGEHNIGIYINGTYYELQNPDWSSENGLGFFANYNVTFEPGTLTVSAYDIPEDWPHNRWDYLFNDAPFDRNKDFRERKAEVNFVDGGMEI